MKHDQIQKNKSFSNRKRRFAQAAGLLLVLLLLGMFVPGLQQLVSAAEYTSEETGYRAVLKDDADLLTDEQEQKLLEKMKNILPYANVAFVSSEERNYDTADYARSWYLENLGEVSGTVLMIDMYNRQIQIFSGQEMYRQISTTRANEITDNIYTYASDGDYYACGYQAFDQIQTILEGGSIVTPMKYATNALFAVGIVFLINFIIVYSQRRKAKNALALRSATGESKSYAHYGAVQNVTAVMTRQTRKRHVESSGGGGFSGGGGGGFSGGGGGGGFSGGGGGHSF